MNRQQLLKEIREKGKLYSEENEFIIPIMAFTNPGFQHLDSIRCAFCQKTKSKDEFRISAFDFENHSRMSMLDTTCNQCMQWGGKYSNPVEL